MDKHNPQAICILSNPITIHQPNSAKDRSECTYHHEVKSDKFSRGEHLCAKESWWVTEARRLRALLVLIGIHCRGFPHLFSADRDRREWKLLSCRKLVACGIRELLLPPTKALCLDWDFFYKNLVGTETGDDRIELLLSQMKGKDITELIASGREKLASVPSGGVVAAASFTPAGKW